MMSQSSSDTESESKSDKDMCLTAKFKYISWYLDNGCSHHMMKEKRMFENLYLKDEGYTGFERNQKG